MTQNDNTFGTEIHIKNHFLCPGVATRRKTMCMDFGNYEFSEQYKKYVLYSLNFNLLDTYTNNILRVVVTYSVHKL